MDESGYLLNTGTKPRVSVSSLRSPSGKITDVGTDHVHMKFFGQGASLLYTIFTIDV